jgi:hypothetical protein
VRFVGIDPGVTGALALIAPDDTQVHDMPRTVDGVDGKLLWKLLALWGPDEVIVERTHAMPKNGSKAAYSQGDSNGSIRTAVHITGIPLVWVPPQTWQRHYSLFGGNFTDTERKQRSRWRAQELFPSLADQLGRAKDHNRAEALLIAEYGKRTSITAAVLSG